MALEDYKDLFGDQFDDIVDAILKGGLTPQVEAMIVGTIDQMVFNVNVFSEKINKTVVNMTNAGMNRQVITNTLNQDMKNGGQIFGELRNETRETLVGGINKSGALGQYETYLDNGITEESKFAWVTASGHKICIDCAGRGGVEKTFEQWESEGLPGSGWSVCRGYCYCVIDPVGKMDKQVEINTKSVKEKGASIRPKKTVDPITRINKFINGASLGRFADEVVNGKKQYDWDGTWTGRYKRKPAGFTNFKGVSQDKLNIIADALEDTLGRYNISVQHLGTSGVGYSGKNANAMAWRVQNSRKDYLITWKKKYIQSYDKTDRHDIWLKRRERNVAVLKENIKYYERNIANTTDRMSKIRYQNGLKRAKEMLKNESDPRIKRWSISSVADDPLYATSKHEAWHQIDYQLRADGVQLRRKFSEFLNEAGVTRSDWMEVSEYAGDSIAELWAETGTALDMGFSVPPKIKKAFIATIEQAGFTYP